MWQWLLTLLRAIFLPPSSPAVPLPPAAPVPYPQAPPLPTAPTPDQLNTSLLRAHNEARAQYNVPALIWRADVSAAAQAHADWMARMRNMSHDEFGSSTPTLRDRLRVHGHYLFSNAGENIAAGQRDPDEVMEAWLHSPGHRANILASDFWHVGFGVAADAFGHLYWCTVLARPLSRGVHHKLQRVLARVSLPPALVRQR